MTRHPLALALLALGCSEPALEPWDKPTAAMAAPERSCRLCDFQNSCSNSDRPGLRWCAAPNDDGEIGCWTQWDDAENVPCEPEHGATDGDIGFKVWLARS